VPEDDFTVAVEMLVEGDAVIRAAKEAGQRALAVLKPFTAEVLAVEFDQIEGAEHGGVVAKPITESVEYREAAFVDHDRLTVHDARSHRQARDRVDDLREARWEVIPLAGEQPDALGVPPRENAEAVVLRLLIIEKSIPFARSAAAAALVRSVRTFSLVTNVPSTSEITAEHLIGRERARVMTIYRHRHRRPATSGHLAPRR